MSTKKIWTWAIILGVATASLVYFSVFYQPGETQVPTIAHAAQQKDQSKETDKETKAKVKSEDKKKPTEKKDQGKEPNTLLPIEKGKRAISIAVSDAQGVSHFIKAGSYVDVVYFDVPPKGTKDPKERTATQLLAQNVKVLAIGFGTDTKASAKRYKTVTLEVTPKEGLAIGLATNGKVYLMLRGKGDHDTKPDHTHVFLKDIHKGVYN